MEGTKTFSQKKKTLQSGRGLKCSTDSNVSELHWSVVEVPEVEATQTQTDRRTLDLWFQCELEPEIPNIKQLFWVLLEPGTLGSVRRFVCCSK